MRTPITFYLSSLYNVGRLRELRRDIVALEKELPFLQTSVDSLKEKCDEHFLVYRTKQDEIGREVQKKKEALNTASEARDAVTPRDSFTGERSYSVITDEKSKYFDRAKFDACLAYDTAEAAYREGKHRTADRKPVDLAENNLRQASHALETQRYKVGRAREELAKVLAGLPDGTAALSEETIDYLSTFSIEGLDINLAPTWGPDDLCRSEELAIVRGEIPFTCDECVHGNLIYTSPSHPVQVILDDRWRHWTCMARYSLELKQNPPFLQGAVPSRFAHHRLHSLDVWEASRLSAKEQTEWISQIPETPYDLDGWLLLGPPGTSKTTFASAAIHDWLTLRAIENPHLLESRYDSKSRQDLFKPYQLNYWFVVTDKWLNDVEEWKSRDYGAEEQPEPPSVTPEAIATMTEETGVRPILFLDEIDKIGNPTPRRLQLLYGLVNEVYNLRGVIVSTANLPKAKLKSFFKGPIGEPLYRRLTGEQDQRGRFLTWTLVPEELKKPTKK